jgi:hypothetical protein
VQNVSMDLDAAGREGLILYTASLSLLTQREALLKSRASISCHIIPVSASVPVFPFISVHKINFSNGKC